MNTYTKKLRSRYNKPDGANVIEDMPPKRAAEQSSAFKRRRQDSIVNTEKHTNEKGKHKIPLDPSPKRKRLHSVLDINNLKLQSETKKPEPNSAVVSNGELRKSPRRPRMASLNAKAKVNAVLDCFKPDAKKDVVFKRVEPPLHKKDKVITRKAIRFLESDIKNENDEFQSNEIVHSNKMNETETLTAENSPVSDLKIEERNSTVKKQPGDEQVQQELSPVTEAISQCKNEKSKIETVEKSVQTDLHHKYSQTNDADLFLFGTKTICTCATESTKIEDDYLYEKHTKSSPIYIKSNVFVHSKAHTLAIPLIKRHFYFQDSKEHLFPTTPLVNITQLQSDCLSNVFLQHYPLNAKLMFIASQLNGIKKEGTNPLSMEECEKERKEKSKEVGKNGESIHKIKEKKLTVPSNLNSSTKPSNTKNKQNGNKFENKSKRKNSKVKFEKSCNGWVFEGQAVEDTYKQGNQIICRTYYPAISRNVDIISVQDAVILKSGHESSESDYVARILQFWEDSAGIYAGEMMMSVLWYYKPEQMRAKCADIIKCEEMELFASRHKDDNSVACILEKCYVVSYSQFCRFRAQSRLAKEGRTSKDSLVPQNKTARSKWLPSPKTNISLVYFCRNAYDYRSGKLIKQP